jgi:tetratricopeptide (TPR) repeat protein
MDFDNTKVVALLGLSPMDLDMLTNNAPEQDDIDNLPSLLAEIYSKRGNYTKAFMCLQNARNEVPDYLTIEVYEKANRILDAYNAALEAFLAEPGMIIYQKCAYLSRLIYKQSQFQRIVRSRLCQDFGFYQKILIFENSYDELFHLSLDHPESLKIAIVVFLSLAYDGDDFDEESLIKTIVIKMHAPPYVDDLYLKTERLISTYIDYLSNRIGWGDHELSVMQQLLEEHRKRNGFESIHNELR